MKKTLFFLLLLLFLLAGCAAQDGELSKNTEIYKGNVINADYKVPQNLTELASASEDIVQVKLVRNKKSGEENNTISEVEIIKSYKGTYKAGNKIDISEPWFFVAGKYQAVENYIALEKDLIYILFLNGGHDQSEINYISSMGYGKFCESLQEKTAIMQDFSTVEEIQPYDFISNLDEEVLKYQEIKQEVLKTYN